MEPYSVNISVAELRRTEQAAEDLLNAARISCPGWRIIETAGGYVAVPADSVLLQAISLDELVGKIRKQP